MNFIRSFAPWIVFAVTATHLDWRPSALIGLAIAIALVAWEVRTGAKPEAMVIELSAGAFFALVAAIAFIAPHSPVRNDLVALSAAWLALTAWGSLAIRRPFTLGIARRMVEPHVRTSPIFLRTNVIITAVWAACFTAEAVTVAVVTVVMPHAATPIVVLKIATFAIPAVFTVRYPAHVRARAERAAA